MLTQYLIRSYIKWILRYPSLRERVHAMNIIREIYAERNLDVQYGFEKVEIEAINIMFEHHFDLDYMHGMTLSQFYTRIRPSWKSEFLVIVKADFMQITHVDRREQVHMPGFGNVEYQKMLEAVYLEDRHTHLLALATHMQQYTLIMDDEVQFEHKLQQRVLWLQRNHPNTYAILKKNVAIDWGKYEIPCSTPQPAPSYLARAQNLFNW